MAPSFRRLTAGALGTVAAIVVCGGVVAPGHDVVDAQGAGLTASALWLAPASDPIAPSPIAQAAAWIANDHPDMAVPLLVRSVDDPELGGYARLYLGRAYLALGQPERARVAAVQLVERGPVGYLGEAALWLLADTAAAADEWAESERALQTLVAGRPANPQQAYLRLAKAAERVGDAAVARDSYTKVYYGWPLSAEAGEAELALGRIGQSSGDDTERKNQDLTPSELGRAQALFAGRRYADARRAFQALRARATGDDRWPLDLKLAECDVLLQGYAIGRDALLAYAARVPAPHPEADFYLLLALRGLKRESEYVSAVWAFAQANPGLPLAETALNDLATYYILNNDDAKAADVFGQMFAAFPAGAFADRAAWRAGWWAYKSGNFRETIRLFEAAATSLRRADYRPAWLYWAGRSYEALGDAQAAAGAYRRVVADYRNSYYGREATGAIERLGVDRSAVMLASARREAPPVASPGPVPANAPLIQRLLEAGLYDDAIAEVRRVQAESGNTPMLDATLAYALNRKGDLRAAIVAMRRAYPQFMADGGEALPRQILSVIFPVAHWDLIQRYSSEHHLDPYLVAALVAQESTFQADIRSSANAWGLMQIVPATGRRYATKTGVRPFSTARLTDPDVNVRIGTAYFADLISQFNDVAAALAAYNAGESRVSRWRAERPGISRDEFVDDIPFPETQNYVKRIIGTAEDYRLLYGPNQMAAVRESAR